MRSKNAFDELCNVRHGGVQRRSLRLPTLITRMFAKSISAARWREFIWLLNREVDAPGKERDGIVHGWVLQKANMGVAWHRIHSISPRSASAAN
jgi:hypothetical protein